MCCYKHLEENIIINLVKINKKNKMEELTEQQIKKHISAAYDSVDLINKLNLLETKTEEDLEKLKTNKKHIKIMLNKKWFIEALTTEQKTELKNIFKQNR